MLVNYIYDDLKQNDLIYLQKLFGSKEYADIFFESETSLKSWRERYEHIKSFKINKRNDENIGVINLKIDEYVEILLVVINPELLSMGVGTRIFEDIFEKYRCREYRVTVKESNIWARNFYERLGFILVDEVVQDLGKNGKHKYLNLVKRTDF